MGTEPTTTPSAPDAEPREVGFFARLFDMSFKTFITPSIVSLVYMISIGLAGLITGVFIIALFADEPGAGLLALIFGPLLFLLYVMVARIYLEIVVVLFRIEANTRSRNE